MRKFAEHRIDKINLSNGAKLINIFAPDLPVSITAIYVRAGSRFDPKGKEGLAHFLEHLMMGRTKKYPQKIQRLQAMESLGIICNAVTTNEIAGYYSFQSPRHAFQALSFLIDGLRNSVITEKDVKDEKEIIINEEIDNRANPEDYIWRLSDQALWPKSSFGGVYGNKKSISSIGLKDIIDFKNNFYIPENIAFVVINGGKISDIKKYIEKNYLYGSSAPRKLENCGKEIFSKPELITIEYRKTAKAEVAINYRTAGIHEYKDNAVLDLLKEYLADNWMSKLVEKLRIEKKLTYWVSGEVAEFSDTGRLSLFFSVDPGKINEALKIVSDEIKKIQKIKISKLILDKYKTLYISSIIKNYTNPDALLWYYGWPAALGARIRTKEEYIKTIKNITPVDIQKIARKYLTSDNLAVAFIGSIKKSEIKLK